MKRVLVLLVLAAIATAGYFLYRRYAASPGVAPDRLYVSGTIEAHESLLSFKVPGRIVELLVEEGQRVEAGQVLARLDDADFRQQVALEEATLRVREANLALVEAGPRRQEVQAARQLVRDAEAEVELRRLDFQRAERLFARDVIPEQERDRARTALERVEATLARAREQLNALEEGSREEEIRVARTLVQQSRAALELARIRLSHTVLTAPRAGIVLVRQAELGEVVAAGTPVLTLANLDNVWLRAYISETDLGRIRWGQAVEVTTDTYPGKVYPGRISFIASEAEFTPKSVQTQRERVTLVYRIKIDVPNPNHELKPGMPADAVLVPQLERSDATGAAGNP
ncbi:MAG: efflux RND transporter periplasmic adaptor subunit [Firmicutes bacterium]|nr:efflux RND transporter periplasmic adaptor subunit [Bacillota bacterium]